MAASVLAVLKNPLILGISMFGVTYGGYTLIEILAAGRPFDIEEDLKGKTYIITGANSGIGQALAKKLAQKNARVILACRNREKCLEVRNDIVLSTKNKEVFCRKCDLADFDSIKNFVAHLYEGKNQRFEQIDGVVNNAAVMKPARDVNKNGIESTLATNHMGTFLLTGLLLEKLLKQDVPSRIVFLNTNLASQDKLMLDLNKLNDADENDDYDGFSVYKNTKLAELIFAKELSERLKDTKVSVIAVDPGRTKTKLTSEMPFTRFFISRMVLGFVGFLLGERKPDQAIKPVLCAVAGDEENVRNGVFLNRMRQEQSWGPNAENTLLRQQLWMMSEQWTGISSYLSESNAKKNEGELESKKRSWKNLWLG